MQTVCSTYTEMLGKAIWRQRIQENPSVRPGLCPGPRWGSLQRFRKPPSWWGGAGCPLPKNPIPPLSALVVVVGDW